MKEFIFNLQRFATNWQLDSDPTKTYTTLDNVISNAKDGDSFTLTSGPQGGSQVKTFTTNITLSLGGEGSSLEKLNTSPTWNPNAGIVVSSGKTLIVKDGTFKASVTNNGTLIFDNLTYSGTVSGNGIDEVRNGSDVTINAKTNLPKSTSGSTLTIEKDITISGVSDNSTVIAKGNVTVESITDSTIKISKGKTITDTRGTYIYECTKATDGLTFAYDSSGDNVSVTNLSQGDKFNATTTGSDEGKITYEVVSSNRIFGTDSSNKTKYYGGETPPDGAYPMSDLAFSKLIEFIKIDNDKLEIDSTKLDSMSSDTEVHILSSDLSKKYGSIIKHSNSNTYSLGTIGTQNLEKLASITIEENTTAYIDKHFQGVPIIINGTTFSSTSTSDDFTVVGASAVSISGSQAVSLKSGTIQTSVAAQSITAGSYTILGYADKNGQNDGVNVAVSSGSTQLADIDVGESFMLNNKNYTNVEGVGLLSGNSIYVGDATVDSGTYAVELKNLSNMRQMLAPDNETLVLGGSNNYSAIIVDDISAPSVKYADLTIASGNKYTLSTLSSSDAKTEDFKDVVSTISVASGNFTFNQKLLGNNMTIKTAGGATFIVTGSEETFTVNTTGATPVITNATAITLINGTITAASTQTITLGNGSNAKVLTFTGNNVTVTANDTNKTYTISAEKGNAITLDNKTYTLDSTSDGMTFTVDSTGDIMISDLATKDKDAFTYDSTNYSLRGGGFISTKDSLSYRIWTADSDHSPSGGSLSADDLTLDSNWSYVLETDGKGGVSIPSSLNGSVVIADTPNFANTYGTLQTASGKYTLTHGDKDLSLSAISLESASYLSVEGALNNTSIETDLATISVILDDDTSGYEITLSGSAASISGVEQVSLIGGSLASDSSTTLYAGGSFFVAKEDAKITVASDQSDVSISGLDTNQNLEVNNKTYTLSSVGLKDENKYLLGSNKNTQLLSEISDKNKWVTAIVADELTISSASKNAIIVDDADNPQILYADLTTVSGGYSLVKSEGGVAFPADSVINIDNTKVTLSSDFNNVKIKGIRSGAEFSVGDVDDTYSVTDAPKGAIIGDANKISLTAGVLSITSGQSVEYSSGTVLADNHSIVGMGQDISVTYETSGVSITALDAADVIIVDKLEYTLLSGGRFERSDGKIWNSNPITGSVTVDNLLNPKNWNSASHVIISNKTLTLDDSAVSILSGGGKAYVVEENNAAKIYGTLTYDPSDNIYTLATDGQTNAADFDKIKISGSDKNVSIASDITNKTITAGDTTFKVTAASGYTVNYTSDAVSVSKDATALTLTGGTLTLTDSGQIVTANGNKINVESGTITVTNTSNTVTIDSLDEAGDSVKIGSTVYTLKDGEIGISVTSSGTRITGITFGDYFTIGEKEYTYTKSGLVKKDGEVYYLWNGSDISNGLDASRLTQTDNDDWNEILEAPSGNLTISNETPPTKKFHVADISNFPESLTLYGILSFSGGVYTLTKSSADNVPTSITLDSVRANLPAEYTNTIIASDSSFNVIASSGYTVDDLGEHPILTNARTVTLTDGIIVATKDLPIVVLGKTVTAKTGDMTVGIENGRAFIGELSTGDIFTVDGVTYEQTAAGLFDAKNEKIIPDTNETYYLDETSRTIIAVKNTTLDLSKQKTDALVYDSVTNPTTLLATLTLGSEIQLAGGEDAAAKIKTIKISKDTDINVDFATTVEIPKGTSIVNGEKYDAKTELVVDSDSSSSTLYSGTVKLDSGTPRVNPTNDKEFTIESGTINATVVKGTITKLDDVVEGDTFTYDGKTYTQTAVGLMTGSTMSEALSGKSIDMSKLTAAKFSDLIAPAGGVINLNDVKGTSIVVDDTNNPTKKFGTLTIGDSTYTTDFEIQLISRGTVTINGQKFTSSDDITLDTTAKTATLNEGTVSLSGGDSINATQDGMLTVTSGNVTATALAGHFTKLDGVDAGESFTYGGKTYMQTALGLVTDSKLCDNLAGTSIDMSQLSSANFYEVIAPVNGVIKLSDVKQSSIVVDDLDNPTKRLGTLTKDGMIYSVDFNAQLIASGDVSVNGQKYSPDGDITLDATAKTSTLKSGTVKLSDSAVTISNGENISATSGEITVTVKDSVTIGNLNAGDDFMAGSTEYTVTAAGLFKLEGEEALIYADTLGESITLEKLSEGEWQSLVKISNDRIEVDSGLTAGLLVSDDLSKIYGTLGKTTSGYSLTKASNANEKLSAIDVQGVKLEIAPDFADIALSSDNNKFSLLTLTEKKTAFTLDATSSYPALEGVKSFTVEGAAKISEGQTVTANSNVLNATKGDYTFDGKEISAIDVGDEFKLNGTAYKLISAGLFNVDDSDLVTSGFEGSTLTINDLQEMGLIAPVKGAINLSDVKQSAIVVDDLDNPTKKLGTLTKDGSTYTVDFDTQLIASEDVTVNGQKYSPDGDITLDATAKTSTLKSGTAKLADSAVTISRGENISATSGEITVTVKDGVTIGGLTTGDAFKIDSDSYRVSAVGPINSDEKLWIGKKYSKGLTPEELADASNWKTMFAVEDGNLKVDANTLANGEDVVLVDDDVNPTKIYGNLSKDGDEYNLNDDNATDKLNSVTIDKTIVNIDSDMDGLKVITISKDGTESEFTVKPKDGEDTYTVDATGDTTKVDGADEINIDTGKVNGGNDGTIIKPTDDAKDVAILLDNGKHTVGDDKLIVTGLDDDETIEAKVDDETGDVTSLIGMPEGSSVTIDGETYTAPEDNSTLNYSDKDGWYFDDYDLDAYTVTINKKDDVAVDAGIKFTDVVSGGMTSNGTIKIAADLYDTPVTIVNDSKSSQTISDAEGTLIQSLDKGDSVTITRDDEVILTAEEGTKFTLPAEDFSINGVELTTTGNTAVEVVYDGVKIDLSKSAAVSFDDKALSGTGSVTLSDSEIIIEGVVKIDNVTYNSDSPVDIALADGVKVSGDTQYTVNFEDGKIVGLENVGANVKISGITDATIKTDEAGTFTVDKKTYTADSGTTYTLENGKIVSADVTDTITGDFSGGLIVNDNPITVSGGTVTVKAEGDVQTAAGSYTVNGHAYTTSGAATYLTEDGKVSGVELKNGTLTAAQNESDFKVNGTSITFANNSSPVTLGIAKGNVSSVFGVDGAIDGLVDATVYNASSATVNGKKISVKGTDCAAVVDDGKAVGLVGVESGATITSAPDMTIKTSGSGSFTVGKNTYNITDTADGAVDIVTDSKNGVSDIKNFSGSISGAVGELTLNGKDFSSSNGEVTVSTNGTNITSIDGIQSGDSIGGEISSANWILPKGTVSINGGSLTLQGDDEVSVKGGNQITGLSKDASLTASAGGTFRVNGRPFAAKAGTSFTVNRDGAYAVNADYLPIIESTPANVVKSRGYSLLESDGTISGEKIAIRNGANATVAVDDTNIIATSGSVTLENYDDNASIQTYEYTNISGAIIGNAIKFGNGVMTLGDAVITYSADARASGMTMTKLLNAVGSELTVGFTHTAGGNIDASSLEGAVLLKGNYALRSSDTQKSGGSSLVSGAGNDTILIGGGDTVNAGAGSNTIYVTDSRWKDSAATIYLSEGRNRVINFNSGFKNNSDKIFVSDITDLGFSYDGSQFVINSSTGQITMNNLASSADLVSSADMVDDSYKLKLTDGRREYNTAVARDGRDITVSDEETSDLFYGKDSGISFSEYSGTVSVNLNDGTGAVGGTSAQFHGITKLEGGSGKYNLTGEDGIANTLIAGSGEGSLHSGSGADLMIGTTNKSGTTTFYFLADDGLDTISGFDFATSSKKSGDLIDITLANEVTGVSLRGNDVVMQINRSADDYLTLTDAKGKDFRINNLTAVVDSNVSYDGFANCYVARANNATMTVSEGMGDVQVWLNDNDNGLHGTFYLGDITVLDAHAADGSNILAGNALNNTVLGGTGENSIWGGFGYSQDTLIGGSGHNTFFFAAYNGDDIVQNAHDGDVVDLTTLKLIDIAATTITAGGAIVEVVDGSKVEVQSNASIEYRLQDGTYTADHTTGQWIEK